MDLILKFNYFFGLQDNAPIIIIFISSFKLDFFNMDDKYYSPFVPVHLIADISKFLSIEFYINNWGKY